MKIYKPDKNIFNEIQKLKKFVDFVANLEFSYEDAKETAKQINCLIENIHNPKTHKDWGVFLNIFDREVQEGIKKEGFYLRNWSVSFESESLEIRAKSSHTAADGWEHYGDDFFYYGSIYFGEDINDQTIYMDVDLEEFIKDAKNYEKYITESLNDVEIDIEIWGSKK